MQLRPLASVTVNLKPPVMVGPGPFGVRVFIEVSDGVHRKRCRGDRTPTVHRQGASRGW